MANGDDAFLAWTLPRTDNCWGAAVWREVADSFRCGSL
jgi:hypothetical protein